MEESFCRLGIFTHPRLSVFFGFIKKSWLSLFVSFALFWLLNNSIGFFLYWFIFVTAIINHCELTTGLTCKIVYVVCVCVCLSVCQCGVLSILPFCPCQFLLTKWLFIYLFIFLPFAFISLCFTEYGNRQPPCAAECVCVCVSCFAQTFNVHLCPVYANITTVSIFFWKGEIWGWSRWSVFCGIPGVFHTPFHCQIKGLWIIQLIFSACDGQGEKYISFSAVQAVKCIKNDMLLICIVHGDY